MKNRAVYEKDPAVNRLLNQGTAKVTRGQSDPEIATLRYEVENFVCDGLYADGLARMLSTYLSNLGKSEQPGIWVSGFYGSGKSHLVKMLQHLWIDFEFPDGAKARGLAKLPKNIKELFVELSSTAKRAGGLHAAAGTMGAGAGDSVRLELLSVIFKSVNLPDDYARACFIMWMRQEGIEDDVRKHLADTGKDWDFELENLYVSEAMGQAVLSARPGFAHTPADALLLIGNQFPEKTDVSVEEMVSKAKQALVRKGKLPLTLIVLDEVQQYVGEDVQRSKAVQDVQEQLCSRLGANVIFVATGQNALSGTALLQRLQGRFPIPVELQDTDVEQVTREVVLKKKPSVEKTLKDLLDTHSGEVERHLSSTKIAFATRDRSLLAQDYPLLPVRRRFWERVLRAVDKAGTGAQLRTQLWIVYDAVEKTADLPIGNVVSAAFLFEHIKTKVLQSGVLLQEISETIARQKNEDDGDIRYQLCALIFLIGQLPHQGPADAGIRANAETLADLLITDLTKSSADLRKKVPELLEKLDACGAVMKVDDEYRMQTREGSEWNQTYLESMNKMLTDAGKLGSERAQLLKSACSDMLSKQKLTHGTCREARKIEPHFGAEAPATDGTAVPVWIRDGWDVEEKTVLGDARAAGDSVAVVYGFVPKNKAEELKRAVAGYYAATTTLQLKGNPSGDEGIEARKAMETRQEQARRTRDDLINDILNDTAIYIAGGDSVQGMLLETKVQDAAKACLDRLFPQFHQADSPEWHKVIEQAKKGDGDSLTAVNHKGDPDAHPVCSAILSFVGSGKKGSEVRKHFQGPNYGWPIDAIDGSLMALVCSGILQARSGSEVLTAKKLDRKNITAVEFRQENIKLTKTQLIEIRKVFKNIGMTTQVTQESANVPEFLNRMKALAMEAGGDAPLPRCPDARHLDDLANRVGNDQLKAIFDAKDRLSEEISDWQEKKKAIAKREPQWRDLKRLLEHAADLPIASVAKPEIEAIEQGRSLLADPDPVPGLVDKLAQALRDSLNQVYSQCKQVHQDGMAGCDASPVWRKLSPEQQELIVAQHQLDHLPGIAVGSSEEVLCTLNATKLKEWSNLCDALATRFANALTAAAKLLEPKAQYVKLPSTTIKDETELKPWLTSTEQLLREKLKDGPVIL